MHDDTLLISKLKTLVEKAVSKEFEVKSKDILIEYPNDQANGDYACNIALRLGKQLGKNPRDVALSIVGNFPKNDLVDKTLVAGPGFINMFVSGQRLDEELDDVLAQKDGYGALQIGRGKTYIFEYSSPNIAKPLGVHHILSTIIGQSLYDIYSKIGFKTISINHIGDWGTQFGKVIYAYKKWGDEKKIEKDPIPELLKLYVRFHDESEKDPSLEDEARAEFKNFEKGDKENRKLWKWFVDESMKAIEKTYTKLGRMHFDHIQGESFYEDKMESILKEGKKKNIFVEGEEGAFIIEYDDPNMPPLVIQKKDGATLYSTRDMATLKYRLDTWKPDKVIYVVDIAQTLYFKQLFDTAKRFDWYEGQGFHAWFGRMRMKEGKMSTRKGSVVLLDEVLDEAVSRASKIIEEKSPHLKNKDEVARVVGIGSIKYNILSQNRTTDIVFDWDRMLSFDGNSAPYIQYTYARAKSILRKIGEISDTAKDKENTKQKIHSLTRLFPKFKEQLLISAEDYKPNILCNYLYDLAQTFNSFYNSVPVLRAEKKIDREIRLKIVAAASQILKNGLALLGVEVVEEM